MSPGPPDPLYTQVPDMHTSPSRRLVPTAIACLSLAACGPSKLVNQWSNRDYKSVQLRKVLPIGVSTQAGVRRRYEDEFVAKLEAAGVSAEPSYRYIPEEGPVDEARIADAVKRAQADAVIITRLVRVDKKTEVIPGVYQPAPAFMLGSIRVFRRLARILRGPTHTRVRRLCIGSQTIRHRKEPNSCGRARCRRPIPPTSTRRSGATSTSW
jgi:hypothetical protein